MVEVRKSLDDIATRYNVFEQDQVLTHAQLNLLADYLADQERLTRVSLIGVGIACGLRASLVDGEVGVTRGVGVTTDGDLLRFGADVLYDRFKPYDEAAPVYTPFYEGDTRIPLYELVAEGVADERSLALSRFRAETGRELAAMVAVLLMECFVKDPDLCSGTDCDNLGKDAINTPRVLLAEAAAVPRLREAIPTPESAGRGLAEVVAERVVLTTAMGTPDALAAAYRTTARRTLDRLLPAFDAVYPACRAFLGDVFAADPAPGWRTALLGLDAQFNVTPRGVQYYYDLVRDLTETYNDFLAALFGDTTVCAPDVAAFPKHLLLGPLAADGDAAGRRTGFYPSPAVSATVEQRERARFLARKLNTLVYTFQVPTAAAVDMRITPSRFEESQLEERAIPYYYRVLGALPIHEHWSFRRQRRGMAAHNYSYNANQWGAQGAAQSPLTAQIGRFPFFRVEGHLGANVEGAVAKLTAEIKSRNLPLAVKAVMLDTDRKKLPWKPPYRLTDLHRFHHILRRDISTQLLDVTRFSDRFRKDVEAAVTANIVNDAADASDSTSVRTIASEKDAAVKAKAAAAQGKLTRAYQEYRADPSWKSDLTDTLQSAAEFKHHLTKVVKTEFTTPFDALIASPHLQWLDWLDDLIKKKEEKTEERVLFAAFLAEHPGLEHFAGVLRGGTFVLAHDTQGTVVADFMLPYICCEEEEAPEEPPAPPTPGFKPPFITDRGLKIIPSRDKFLADRLDDFKKKIEPEWKVPFELEKKYFDTFKDSVALISQVYGGAPPKPTVPGIELPKVSDPKLDERVREVASKVEAVDFLRMEILKPEVVPARQRVLEAQLRKAEVELAKSVSSTAQYVAESSMDVGAGTDGFAAMATVSNAATRIGSREGLAEIKSGLTGVLNRPGNTEGLKAVIGNVIKARGLG